MQAQAETIVKIDATNVKKRSDISPEIEAQIYGLPLRSLSIAALRFLAHKRGMQKIPNAAKADLIDLITAHRGLSGIRITGA